MKTEPRIHGFVQPRVAPVTPIKKKKKEKEKKKKGPGKAKKHIVLLFIESQKKKRIGYNVEKHVLRLLFLFTL